MSGRPIAQVAKELGVNHETLRTWVRTAEAAERPGAVAESAKDADLARLRKEVAELRLEQEILRKAAAYFALLSAEELTVVCADLMSADPDRVAPSRGHTSAVQNW